MSDPNAKAFEEKLLTIDLVDALRREEMRLDAALSDSERMLALREEIKAYYAKAGISVSEAIIDQAIAERQAQRYAFAAPRLSAAGKFFATLYVRRNAVVMGVAALALIALIAQQIDSSYQGWQQERELATYRSRITTQVGDVQRAFADWKSLPETLPAFPPAEVAAAGSWYQQLGDAYAQARSVLREHATCSVVSVPEKLAPGWSGEANLAHCAAQAPAIAAAVQRAQQQLGAATATAQALNAHGDLRAQFAAQPALLDWPATAQAWQDVNTQALRSEGREAFIAAVTAATATVTEIAGQSRAYAEAQQCLTTAGAEASGNDAEQLNALITQGQQLRTGNADAGQLKTWQTQARQTCEFFRQAMELQIVSGGREKTGVRRDFNKKTSGYYIIADVLTPAGTPASALVTDVEQGQRHYLQRVGVRTSNEQYEAIKRDKQDDGRISQRLIGRKPANSLQWQLQPEYNTDFIVRW